MLAIIGRKEIQGSEERLKKEKERTRKKKKEREGEKEEKIEREEEASKLRPELAARLPLTCQQERAVLCKS